MTHTCLQQEPHYRAEVGQMFALSVHRYYSGRHFDSVCKQEVPSKGCSHKVMKSAFLKTRWKRDCVVLESETLGADSELQLSWAGPMSAWRIWAWSVATWIWNFPGFSVGPLSYSWSHEAYGRYSHSLPVTPLPDSFPQLSLPHVFDYYLEVTGSSWLCFVQDTLRQGDLWTVESAVGSIVPCSYPTLSGIFPRIC